MRRLISVLAVLLYGAPVLSLVGYVRTPTGSFKEAVTTDALTSAYGAEGVGWER